MHSKETILNNLSKFKPTKHNRFWWWRRYDIGEKPISKKSSILDKIEAGYYNFPESYFWQAQLALIELNEYHPEDIERKGVAKSKYKRLMDDYYKDENIKLERIIEDFTNGYILKKEQVKEIIESFNGDIKELYNFFEKNHKYPIQPIWRRSF
jgi:hypothetical protein